MMKQKKQVPNRRFKGFTGEWEKRKLEEVAPLQRGFDLTRSNMSKGPYPVIFSNGIGAWNSMYKIKGPGVITGRSGSIGNVSYVEQNYWPHNTSLWVTDFFENYPLYIYYLYEKVDLSKFGTGSGVPTLNRNDVHDYSVFVPSPKEQKKIGQFFKHLDEMIALEQRKINKIKALKSAYLAEMFPAEGERVPKRRFEGFADEWTECKIKDLGWFGRTYSYSRSNEGEGQYYHIHYGDIHSKYAGVVKKNTTIPSIKSEQKHETLNNRDLVIADASEDYKDLGKTIMIEETNRRKIIAGLHTFKFTTNKYLNSLFYLYYSQTKLFKRFSYKMGTGISVFGISKENISQMALNIPSTTEQQKIGEFFKKLDDAISNHQQKLEKLKATKQAYLHEMFV